MQLRQADGARPIIGFSLLLIILLATGPANAQDLRVVGDPELVSGDESTSYMRPIWSPSGIQIAFAGGNYNGLYLAGIDGEAVVRLTDEPAAGYGAEWSHTGELILSRVAVQDGVQREHVVKLFEVDSRQEQVIARRDVSHSLPKWTSDGSHVYVYGDDEASIVNAGIASKTAGEDGPIVLSKDGAVAVASAAEPTPREIYRPDEGDVLRLATSPDGSRVAFEVLGGSLFVMNADGSGLTEIGPGEAARFSPDGQWIVFMRTADDGHQITSSDLWAARVDGSSVVRLTQTADRLEMNPDWSPDGDAVAYDDRGSIYTIAVSR